MNMLTIVVNIGRLENQCPVSDDLLGYTFVSTASWWHIYSPPSDEYPFLLIMYEGVNIYRSM